MSRCSGKVQDPTIRPHTSRSLRVPPPRCPLPPFPHRPFLVRRPTRWLLRRLFFLPLSPAHQSPRLDTYAPEVSQQRWELRPILRAKVRLHNTSFQSALVVVPIGRWLFVRPHHVQVSPQAASALITASPRLRVNSDEEPAGEGCYLPPRIGSSL